jgi:peptide/nickel transport system permease protein
MSVHPMTWLLRRLLVSLLVVAAVAAATALLLQWAPGDARAALADGLSRVEASRPISPRESPWRWFGGLVRGDLGHSITHGRPVGELLTDRLPRTLLLTFTAALIQLAMGILAGILLARWRGGWLDGALSTALFVLDAMPPFWIGILLILIFAMGLGLFPVGGTTSYLFERPGLLPRVVDGLWHLILPALALALGGIATVARFTRGGLLDAFAQPYVIGASAHGLARRTVLARYALRNSLLPLITLVGLSFPALVGGAIIVEAVFNWQGVGMLAADAVRERDVPVLLGTTVLFAIFVVFGNLVADLLYAAADPRVRSRNL